MMLNSDLSKIVLQYSTEHFGSVLFLFFLGQNIEWKTFLAYRVSGITQIDKLKNYVIILSLSEYFSL